MMPIQPPNQPTRHEYVVLVHGLARSPRSLNRAERFFRQQGYEVFNFGYPSRKFPIETLSAEFLQPFIATHCADETRRLHFLTHSMGGIVVRQYLKQTRPANLGRVVMLAPPNQGSEVVDWQKKRLKIIRRVLGPAWAQLSTDAASLPVSLGAVDFELGVIAGNRSFEPLHSWFIIPGADDGKVSAERTKIPGMTDYLVVPRTHTFIMNDPNVLRQAAYFFETGKFAAAPDYKGKR